MHLITSEDDLLSQPDEQYMDDAQQAFFQRLLETQRDDLRTRIDNEMNELREIEPASDEVDVAAREEQRQWQLRRLEREKKLLDKIDSALDRLARGEYGWCRETGEPIGLRRLLLRPTAELCIEAKEREERRERHLRDA
ncbi:RNA polymerase-binding protein DksA [Metapseudomonas otitidis]|uniref:RNA polymerase-binding protein DksA n=1 Tax=Metapseudomonas otitidis TaxID=319939 RepID=UPI003CF61015